MAPVREVFNGNKLISAIILTVFSLLIAWFIWVTTNAFAAKVERESNRLNVEFLAKEVISLKYDLKELQNGLHKFEVSTNRNQEKIIALLNTINKK